jgi:hypothetical protein
LVVVGDGGENAVDLPTHDESHFPVRFEIPRDVPAPEASTADIAVESPREGVDPDATTLFLDWDRERYAGAVPRRVPLPIDETGPTWLAFPHARYVLCAKHASGRVEVVYVTSLLGRRDSLIPAGFVERIVTDDRSVTVVVDGRPYLYAVDAGTTMDLTSRKVLGGQ